MDGVFLKLFVPQTEKYDGKLLYEWLLQEARDSGIAGGSVFRAMAGFGRHGTLHEEHFFELAGNVPLTVEFFADSQAVDCLLSSLQAHGISLFYIRQTATAGVTAP